MAAHDMALLDEALSRARDLDDDGGANVPGDLVRRAQAARDRLRLEHAACDAIRAAMGAGGWLRPGDLPDIDGIASAVDGAGRLGLHVPGGADLVAQGGTLRDLRAAMARADGSKDAAVWAPVEAIVKSAAGALADHDEVRAARAQVVQFARTGRVERDLIGAVAARDLAAIEHGLDQAAGLHMSDDKYPILADGKARVAVCVCVWCVCALTPPRPSVQRDGTGRRSATRNGPWPRPCASCPATCWRTPGRAPPPSSTRTSPTTCAPAWRCSTRYVRACRPPDRPPH